MAIPTPGVSSSNVPLTTPEATPNNSPVPPAPHSQDSIEMREPVNATNSGFCSSIYSAISSILRSIKAKILQFIHYFFPRETNTNRPEFFTTTLNAIQDPAQSCARKLDSFSDFFPNCRNHLQSHPSDENMMNGCIYEMFAALPSDLTRAIIHKALQLSNYSTASGERIQVSITSQENDILPIGQLPVGQLPAAADSLRKLYPDAFFMSQFIVISDGNTSDRAKVEALKALVNFNLDVRFDGFNLHSTETEENWKTALQDATRELPENIKEVLFRKMWQHSQPCDGRDAFLENPRSDQAKQAVEETLQAFPNG